MLKKISEYNYLFFALLIIVVVNIIAFISFKKITTVSNKISQTLQNNLPASFVAKQAMIELGAAENYARTYYLTEDDESLKNFYKTTYDIRSSISKLKTYTSSADTSLIDSLIYYTKICVVALKSQSYLNDPNRIIGELDELSKKIDLLYSQPSNTQTALKQIADLDTIKKKQSFLKRLFSKKRNSTDSLTAVSNTTSQTTKNLEVKGKLKVVVSSIKSTQTKIIEDSRKSEYELANIVFTSRARINNLIDSLRTHEDVEKRNSSKSAKEELRKLKNFTLASTALLSLFLLALIYFVFAYIKKKAQYAEMLVTARNEAENLAKAKESFLSNMSHEIKTPLNAIQGFSELLLESNLSSEQLDQTTIIRNSAGYLNNLINNVLTNARLNSGKVELTPTSINIKTELTEVFLLLNQQAKRKGITLKFVLENFNDNYIIIDIDKLKQILFNLLGNALKFTQKGSVILEMTSKKDVSENLFIQIKDTGIGIDNTTLPKLFKEFEQGGEQTQIKYGGTGLGLVITKKIINQLNGKISIESEVNIGTVVNVTIPYQLTSATISLEPIKKTFNLDYLANKKILVVDDDEYNRLLLQSILSKHGAKIIKATNGKEALAIANNEPLDLIIMDVRMPEMNGIEATQEIRKQKNNVLILGATAVMNEEKIARCTNAGMNSIIFKPFTKEELALKLNLLFNQQTNKEASVVQKKQSLEQPINLNALDEATGGDENFKQELIAVFYKSLNTACDQINILALEKKYNHISEYAHKILPSCKHFETARLVSALKYLEKLNDATPLNKIEFDNYVKIVNEEVEKINKIIEPLVS